MEYLAHILVVDDEPDLRHIVNILLSSNGYKVTEAANGQEALETLQNNEDIELIILDIMMPGSSGIEVCSQLRQITNVPVLFLTALTQETDKTQAYRSGGDDYLAKPFSQSDLLLKVESLLRRYRVYRGKPNADINITSPIQVDEDITYRNGKRVELTEKEHQIVYYLWCNRGKVCTVENIYENVWHEKYLPSSSNTVMVHILNIRRKLEDNPNKPSFIRTVWGRGYQID